MQSGLFWVGAEHLSPDGFETFVRPYIENRGYSVEGVSQLDDKEQGSLVIAISGEGDLRKGLAEALKESSANADLHNQSLPEYSDDKEYAPQGYFIDSFKTIDVYSGKTSLSEDLRVFVKNYRSQKLSKAFDNMKDSEVRLTARVKDLEDRLKKIAKATEEFTR